MEGNEVYMQRAFIFWNGAGPGGEEGAGMREIRRAGGWANMRLKQRFRTEKREAWGSRSERSEKDCKNHVFRAPVLHHIIYGSSTCARWYGPYMAEMTFVGGVWGSFVSSIITAVTDMVW